MARLTKRFVETLQPTDTDQYIWDTSIPGFGVRVWPLGRRSYIVQYRTRSGQQRRRTIGRHGIVTVEQARTKAQEMLAEVRLGGDPAKPPSRSAVSVADLADRYLREYAIPKKKPKSIKSDAASLRLHILPRFGQKLVPEVTRADISDLQYQMRETPIAANRTIEVISKMFNLAEEWGLRAEGTNPALRIHPYPETKRERYLSPAELARLGEVLSNAERTQTVHPSVIAAIRLLLFTGARSSEILSLRWEWVDMERARIRVPESKTGAKTVLLSAAALEVLQQIPPVPGNPYVLVGKRPGEHWINLRKPWHRLRDQAGIPDVRLHDLRHSFASVGVSMGFSLPIVGKLLGHAKAATTERYAHLAADPVQEATERIGETIAAALQGDRST